MESEEDCYLVKGKSHGLDYNNILSSAYDTLTCLTETSCYISVPALWHTFYLFIKYFEMGLARLSGKFSEYFQVVVPEQHNQLNCLVQFCLHMYLFSLDSSEHSTGLFHPINLEEFYFIFLIFRLVFC